MKKINVTCWECGSIHDINNYCNVCGRNGGRIVGTNIIQRPNEVSNFTSELIRGQMKMQSDEDAKQEFIDFDHHHLVFHISNTTNYSNKIHISVEGCDYKNVVKYWEKSKNAMRYNKGKYSIEHRDGAYHTSINGRTAAISKMEMYCSNSKAFDFDIKWETQYIANPLLFIRQTLDGGVNLDGTLPIVWELGKMGWFDRTNNN